MSKKKENNAAASTSLASTSIQIMNKKLTEH